jgi:hypothetical protein
VLPPPTWTTLRELESFGSVADVLSWTGTRTIERREPRLIEEHGTRMLVLPGDPLNPQPGAVPFETRFVWTDDRWRPEA